eukprot:1152265-Pelagomonas_calceolata.AAC.10
MTKALESWARGLDQPSSYSFHLFSQESPLMAPRQHQELPLTATHITYHRTTAHPDMTTAGVVFGHKPSQGDCAPRHDHSRCCVWAQAITGRLRIQT